MAVEESIVMCDRNSMMKRAIDESSRHKYFDLLILGALLFSSLSTMMGIRSGCCVLIVVDICLRSWKSNRSLNVLVCMRATPIATAEWSVISVGLLVRNGSRVVGSD